MKKLYSSSQWRKYTLIRQKRAAKSHDRNRKAPLRKHHFRKSVRLVRELERLARIEPQYIQAPANFSLVENPEGFCEFLGRVHTALKNYRSIEIDHRQVETQTPEALTAFISVLADPKYKFTRHQGKLPNNPIQKQMFLDSGICSYLKLDKPVNSSESGNICRKRHHRVDPKTAFALKRFAVEKIFGKNEKHQGLYRMLIELMANTHNHAAGKDEGVERWWGAVYCGERNRACFTFVDNGVGILESVGETMGVFRKAARTLGIQNNRDFLKMLLNGELKSSTKLAHRGKGMPMIYGLAMDGLIENLTVITNDVLARISDNEYSGLEAKFPGTLWYWEIPAHEQVLGEVSI